MPWFGRPAKERMDEMTREEFEQFCRLTPKGTPLTLDNRDLHLRGRFVGCFEGAILVEVNGNVSLWPHETCAVERRDDPSPRYS